MPQPILAPPADLYKVLTRTVDTKRKLRTTHPYWSAPCNRARGLVVHVVLAQVRGDCNPRSLTPGKDGLLRVIRDYGVLPTGTSARSAARAALSEAQALADRLNAGEPVPPEVAAAHALVARERDEARREYMRTYARRRALRLSLTEQERATWGVKP